MFPTFDLTEENLEQKATLVKKIITKNEKTIEELLKIENKTYENFAKPFQQISHDMEILFTPISHFNYVNNTPITEKIYNELLPLLTEYETKISQNKDIYNSFLHIQKEENLTKEQEKVIENEIKDFLLSGVNLDQDKKDRLKEINLSLSENQTLFAQNLLKATDSFSMEVQLEDIKEFPKSDLANAKKDDKYIVTLKQPSYIAFMTYSTNSKLKEKLYKAYVTRAPQNEELITKILSLRDEKAKLLGFENFAQLSLKKKMAKNSDEVLEFLNSLAKNSKASAKLEYDELVAFSKQSSLEPWDITYFANKLKKDKYSIDDETYMPYFEKSQTLKGLFTFLHKLFGVSFKQSDTQTWHESVEVYDISEDGEIKARIYCDLESRNGKRGGAWMNDWVVHHKDRDKKTLPSAFIVGNFSPSSKNTPSLLRPDDVETLFHEMGHAIHHLFSEVSEINVSGINGVEWDGVEFPSQFLENFAYEEDVLKLFATHYKTKEPLSPLLIQKLKDAKNFHSSLMMLRQVEFSIFDMMIHLGLYNAKEVGIILNSVREEIAITLPPSYNKFQHSFSHIFAGGYSAGYYSYKWAEVLSADAFFKFIDAGIFDKNLANSYRDEVLKVGGSRSMYDSFIAFNKKEPNPDSLLRLNEIKIIK